MIFYVLVTLTITIRLSSHFCFEKVEKRRVRVLAQRSGGSGPGEEPPEPCAYLSPAPQAEPQAGGLGCGFSSPAPQAEPHALPGFSVSLLLQR